MKWQKSLGSKNPAISREVFRELDYNSYQVGPNHTVRNPQDQKAYDPWADWFNAGLDPEPFTDNFLCGTGGE